MADIYERQGGDITAADMDPPTIPSEITEFYQQSTIFVTGGTGFLGRVFIEKMLRTCSEMKRLYVLIRPKKGKDPQKRFDDMFEGPAFEHIKRKCPQVLQKVVLLNGDCNQPDLGLTDDDKNLLIREVNCVFHFAATVRFDEKLRTSVNINVRSTRDLINMAKQMKHLRAFVHVSTAFSFCTRQNIDEVFYDAPVDGSKLISLTELLDDDKLDKITPALLDEYPNTYVFTKAIAENVVKQEAKGLPAAIVRPSIVTGSVREPVAGWIDSFYGATGIIIGAAIGLLRSLHCDSHLTAEIIPVDYVINSTISTAWDVAKHKSINDNQEHTILLNEQQSKDTFDDDIPLIYNVVSSAQSKITWNELMQLTRKHAIQVPSELMIWHYFFEMRPNKYLHELACFFYQTIPAYIVDFIAYCLGKKPMLVKGYQKINKFSNVLRYFTLREWSYTNQNLQNLWNKMNKNDRDLFEFSMKDFDWDNYFYTYVRGCRCYLLKDPLDTVPKGNVKYYKVMIAHYCLLAILALIFVKIAMSVFGLFF